MAERAISTLYTLLIDRAEAGICRPGIGIESELAELEEELEAAVRKPADGARLIFDEEKLLARCLLRIHQARKVGDEERLRTYTQIAAVLLPVAREHFGKALAARRNTVSTTDQDYIGKR